MGKRKSAGKGSEAKKPKLSEDERKAAAAERKRVKELRDKAREEAETLEIKVLNDAVVKVILSPAPAAVESHVPPALNTANELESKPAAVRGLQNAVARGDNERVQRILNTWRELWVIGEGDITAERASPEQVAAVLGAASEKDALRSRGLEWRPLLPMPMGPGGRVDGFIAAVRLGHLDVARTLEATYPKAVKRDPTALARVLDSANPDLPENTLAFLLERCDSADDLVDALAVAALGKGLRQLLQRLLRYRLKLSMRTPDEGGDAAELGASQNADEDVEMEAGEGDDVMAVKVKSEDAALEAEADAAAEGGEDGDVDASPALRAAARIKEGLRRLHLAALEADSVAELEAVAELNEDSVNAPALGAYVTPVHLAALNPRGEILAALVKAGGDLTINTDTGLSPLMIAAMAPDGTPGVDAPEVERDATLPEFLEVVKPAPTLQYLAEELDEDLAKEVEYHWRDGRRKLTNLAIDSGRLHNAAWMAFNFGPKESQRFRPHGGEANLLGDALSMGDPRFFQLLLCHEDFKRELRRETSAVSGAHLLTSAIERGSHSAVRALLSGSLEMPRDPPTEEELMEQYGVALKASKSARASGDDSNAFATEAEINAAIGSDSEGADEDEMDEAAQAAAALAAEVDADSDPLKPRARQSHLVAATKAEQYDLAKLLIDEFHVPLDTEVGAAGAPQEPALHAAVAMDQVDFVKLFLDRGADPRSVSRSGTPAMLRALRTGSLACAQLLLDAGVELDPRAEATKIEAAIKVARDKREEEERKRRDEAQKKAKDGAAAAGGVEGEVDSPFAGWFVVLSGIFSVRKETITQVIESNGGKVQPQVNGKTTHCCYSGQDGVNEWGCLMGKGDSKYKMAKKKKLPFIDEATVLRYLQDTNELLTTQGASLTGGDELFKVEAPFSLMHDALAAGTSGTLNGQVPLAKVLKFLMDRGVDPLVLDQDGRSPLRLAVETLPDSVEECRDAVRTLASVSGPAHVNEYDKTGFNPLLVAAARQKWAFLLEDGLLLNAEADVNAYVRTPEQDPPEADEAADADAKTAMEEEEQEAEDPASASAPAAGAVQPDAEAANEEEEDKKSADAAAAEAAAEEARLEKLRKRREKMRVNSHEGWGFLHLVAVASQTELFERVLALHGDKADLNAKLRTEDSSPLVLCAARSFHICKRLLEDPQVEVNARNASGVGILHAVFDATTVGIRTPPTEERLEEPPVTSSPVTLAPGGVGFSGSDAGGGDGGYANYGRRNRWYGGGYGGSSCDVGETAIQSLIQFERWRGDALDWAMCDAKKRTPLHACAAAVDGTACASLLLKHRPEMLDMVDELGNKPLACALLESKTHIATFLLEKRAALKPGLFTRVEVPLSAEELEALCDERLPKDENGQPVGDLPPADKVRTEIRETSVYEYAVKKNMVGVVFALLQHPDCDLQEALEASISGGSLAWTEQLLQCLEVKEPAFAGKLIQLLYRCTKSPSKESSTRLLELVKRLVHVRPSVEADAEGNNVLHHFVNNNHFAAGLAPLLAVLGPDHVAKLMVSTNAEGETALHVAVRRRRIQVLAALLDDPASASAVQIKDAKGDPPLHLAFAASHEGLAVNTDVMAMLIGKGASLLERGSSGKSAAAVLGVLPDKYRLQLQEALPVGTFDGAEVQSAIQAARLERDAEASRAEAKRSAKLVEYRKARAKLEKQWAKLQTHREAAAKREEERQASLAREGRLVIPVDERQDNWSSYEVFVNEEGVVYDAYLLSADSNASLYGRNAFHLLQLCVLKEDLNKQRLESAGRAATGQVSRRAFYAHVLRNSRYRVMERWGRAGDDYNCKTRQRGFQNLERALAYFDDVFLTKARSKIGPDYAAVASAKYSWIKKLYEEKPPELSEAQRKAEARAVQQAMSAEEAAFLTVVTDLSRVRRELRQCGFDTTATPLAMSLSRSMITRAYELLGRIDRVLVAQERLSILRGRRLREQRNEVQALRSKVRALSNQIYRTVPRGFGSLGSGNLRRMPEIDSRTAVRNEYAVLSSLEDVEETLNLVLGGVSPDDALPHRLSTLRSLLGVNLRPVLGDSDKFKMLSSMMKASSENQTLVYALRATRFEDAERFQPFVADRGQFIQDQGLPRNRLLFHSTGVANAVGIMLRGLCVAPPEAPSAGARFTKGIYFSDSFSKAAAYARSRAEYGGSRGRFGASAGSLDDLNITFVCEVALGDKPFVVRPGTSHTDMEAAAQEHTSLFAPGSMVPDPAGQFITRKGVGVALGATTRNDGKLFQDATGGHSEFVVWNADRVKIKYVLLWR